MDTDPNRWIDRYPKVDQDYGRVTRLEAEIKELQSRIKTLEDNSEAEYTSKITTWAESLGCVQDREARCDSETEPDTEPTYRMVEDGDGDIWGQVGSGKWACITRPSLTIHSWERLQGDYAPLTPHDPGYDCEDHTATKEAPCLKLNPKVETRCGKGKNHIGGHVDDAGRIWFDPLEPEPPRRMADKVKSHTRLKTSDVRAFQKQRIRRQKRAFEELRELDDEFESMETEPQPYRMTRPTSRDALVIDGGKVWRPVLGPDGMWKSDDDSDWVTWEVLTDPEPFQNCALTADDPEPPEGSVVLDVEGQAWQLWGSYWTTDGNEQSWEAIVTDCGPLTLLYRGEA